MGMGTLIIFIAMILVAATAATVLINTTGALQNKALDVGKMTQDEISTGLTVVHINAKNGSAGGLDDFSITTRLSAGSSTIRFDDVLAVLTLDDNSADYSYNASIDCQNSSQLSQTQFGVMYSLESQTQRDGYIQSGDIVELCLQSPRLITESERFRLSLVPRVGIPSRLTLIAPRYFSSVQENLYP